MEKKRIAIVWDTVNKKNIVHIEKEDYKDSGFFDFEDVIMYWCNNSHEYKNLKVFLGEEITPFSGVTPSTNQ